MRDAGHAGHAGSQARKSVRHREFGCTECWCSFVTSSYRILLSATSERAAVSGAVGSDDRAFDLL